MPAKREQRERFRRERQHQEHERERHERSRKFRIRVAAVVGAGVVALGIVFVVSEPGGSSPATASSPATEAGQYAFQVGNPGPGKQAPPIRLPSTRGTTFDLASRRGKTVMLYFQEGLMCQPCWDQMRDLEAQPDKLRSLGIDEVVSVTTDPIDQIQQKVADEGLSTPVLSDPDLAVSRAYSANLYGMMGDSRDGHSFVVVGPDGRIRHRADYGGAPDYTMYVPLRNLVADLRRGLDGTRS
ncbi:MAG: peroxiredoxin family protein [Thermoleophilaceae bacterium]